MPRGPATSRRDFFRNCIAGAVSLASSHSAINTAETLPSPVHRVSIARDMQLRMAAPLQPAQIMPAAPLAGAVDPGRLRKLLDSAIAGLFRREKPERMWSTFVQPGQLIALKVNTLGGRGLSTNVELVNAICERLQESGIRPADIVIWDRDSTELERAGFHIRVGGNQVQCFGTDRVGFEDELEAWGSVGSRISKILSRRCDVLINVPVLKDHDGAGVSIALKNMFGAIHNPNKYHPDGCNPYVADVNMLPTIRSKLRLTICDATTCCYEGGPSYKPEFTWHHNAVIASPDSVALDTIGWGMIEAKRREKGLSTLDVEDRAPHYIATAADAAHRLGISDTNHIAVVETHLS
jgi:uncharacterized protein (DUF362 family)